MTTPPEVCPACRSNQKPTGDIGGAFVLYECGMAVFRRHGTDGDYWVINNKTCSLAFDMAVKLRKGLIELHELSGETTLMNWCALAQEKIRSLLGE